MAPTAADELTHSLSIDGLIPGGVTADQIQHRSWMHTSLLDAQPAERSSSGRTARPVDRIAIARRIVLVRSRRHAPGELLPFYNRERLAAALRCTCASRQDTHADLASLLSFASMISRRARRMILPAPDTGSSKTTSRRSGNLNFAMFCANRNSLSCSNVRVAPGLRTTKAQPRSPYVGSGMATSATE